MNPLAILLEVHAFDGEAADFNRLHSVLWFTDALERDELKAAYLRLARQYHRMRVPMTRMRTPTSNMSTRL